MSDILDYPIVGQFTRNISLSNQITYYKISWAFYHTKSTSILWLFFPLLCPLKSQLHGYYSHYMEILNRGWSKGVCVWGGGGGAGGQDPDSPFWWTAAETPKFHKEAKHVESVRTGAWHYSWTPYLADNRVQGQWAPILVFISFEGWVTKMIDETFIDIYPS